MAVQAILPKTNLKYEDIRDTLAANGGSVNNDVASAFKSSANINEWSKNKPVPFAQPFTEGYPNWYKGTGGFCGFDKNTISPNTYTTIITQYRNNNYWKYQLPKGGEQEPYRLGDFRGYVTNAQPFIKSNINKDETFSVNVSGGYITTLTFGFNKSTVEGSLSLSDFDLAGWIENINSIKLAAIICEGHDVSKTERPIVYKEVQYGDFISSNSPSITLDFDGYSAGYYTAIFMLSVGDDTGRYIPLPFSSDKNYHSANITVTDVAVPNVIFRISTFEFSGSVSMFQKTDVSLISESNPLIMERRGIMKIEVSITGTKDSSSLTISNTLDFNLEIDNLKTGTQFRVLLIDGKAVSYPYNLLGKKSITLTLGTQSISDQLLEEQNANSGYKNFTLNFQNKAIDSVSLYTEVKQ